MADLSAAQRAMLQRLAGVPGDAAGWVACETLRATLPYMEYRAILGLPGAYVEQRGEGRTITAVRLTAAGRALVGEG